jgi:hypothetical protein
LLQWSSGVCDLLLLLLLRVHEIIQHRPRISLPLYSLLSGLLLLLLLLRLDVRLLTLP